MSDYAYEIASWPASEEYLKDPVAVAAPAFTWVVGRNGARTIFHGPEDNGTLLGLVVEFESHQHFKDLNSGANGDHARLRELLKPTKAGQGLNKVVAKFSTDPIPALKAPVVEVSLVTLKPGGDVRLIRETLEKLVAGLSNPAAPSQGGAVGYVIEDPDTTVLIVGWNSAEEHKQALAAQGSGKLQEILDHGIFDVHEYRFIQVNPS
ncbi:hypothetical protein F5148DRAFT_554610 [Russula earlei]|uniref:Uncharacterized protein n=1 Tax=Russula earlei TaxID=71964 RepID=A0ACC0UFS8_9AGAM|nr:hypothetical protein F5148DRAFT_554610 [Russula earlei]